MGMMHGMNNTIKGTSSVYEEVKTVYKIVFIFLLGLQGLGM
jgi:hypothetical protein